VPKHFKINNNYAIFWNNNHVWTLALNGIYEEKMLGFCLDEEDKTKVIHDIRISSKAKEIVIIVGNKINNNNASIIIWNIIKNKEKQAIDVTGTYELLWDDDGCAIVV